MFNIFYTLCFLTVFSRVSSLNFFDFGEIDDKKYGEMPKLFEFDDFQNCSPPKGRFSDKFVPQYCVLNVEIESARNNSDLFKYINTFSANSKQHFNHRNLKRGVCMQSCFEVHSELGDRFRHYKNDDSSIQSDDPTGGMSMVYNKLGNVCINKVLIDTYGLVAKTSVDYCIMKDEISPMDLIDYVFVALSSLIFVLIALSALLGKNKNADALKNFQRTKRLLKAFNVKSNWKNLVDNSNDVSHNNNDTRLQALKVLIMFLFVFAGTYRQISSMPANPMNVEKSYHSAWIYFVDMEIVTSLFLVVCGIQTSISLIPQIQKSSNNWKLIREIISSKFDKLVTLFTIFVMFHATILAKLGSGPFWKGAIMQDFINCRNTWRMNMLTVNNYSKAGSFCIEPSWILSVEFHCTFAGFISLYLLNKFPSARKIITSLTILMTFAVAAFNIYAKKLNPITNISPEILRKSLTNVEDGFSQIYHQTYFNGGSFLLGVLAGYFKLSHEEKKLTQEIKRSSLVLLFIGYVLSSLMIKNFFLLQNVELSNLTFSVVGAYLKFHHGIFLSFFVYKFILKGSAMLWNRRIFKVAEKIFPITFMSSIFLTKLIISSSKILVELTFLKVLGYSFVILIFSYLIGLGLSLMLEIPLAEWKSVEKEKDSEDSTDKKKAE